MVLIFWSGWGALTIVIVGAVTIVVGAIGQLLLTAIGHPGLTFLAVSLGLFSAAAVNWVVGKRLNSAPGRELVDPKTGERLIYRRRNSLFWIPMEYWSIPVAILGFVPLLALPGALHG